ncbi:glutathione S-transferase family protein [Desertibaculum subflavum]|uniref:glutathione S-transferase family protein n=1 Tax=Desertibaculum subflavum TaxID=2268458 RepID=UPI000E670C4A
MSALTLVIGNKNYSSWSLRPWIALKQTGAAFREIRIPLRQPDTRARILEHAPGGKVPILKDGGLTVWESLAILDYLAEKFPAAGLWPTDAAARAEARSIAAEMHAGFVALRQQLPMDIRSRKPLKADEAAQADIARILEMWRGARARHGKGGPFLFGTFTAADAMYAPVATRFRTYGVALDPVTAGYVDAVFALPAMQEWVAAATAEAEVIDY